MKKLFMPLITTIFLTPISTHAACTSSPSCATLGYTATSCASGGVRCPFDTTKLFCPSTKQTCAVGYILYSDMTCAATRISGKTPIGVVGYVRGDKYFAINLTNTWVDCGKQACSSTPEYSDDKKASNYAKNDYDGEGNTASWMLNCRIGDTEYITGYCFRYSTEGTKQGHWYIPAAGELYETIITNKAAVIAGLSLAGGETIPSDIRGDNMSHCTSTRCYSNWACDVSSDILIGINSTSRYARCFISF